ncbi:PhrA family quorum-sensing system peptide [Streptococcus pneumoniae]|uniref:PhrA family quorum-sensing system peptide n=1 Tax=Streptococcus pneumoniae TaxID=1313 RepID=UPI0005DC20BE|nr:PhrA family quorum-sensing system peptide [Streptococcus pneumoniae]COI00342.1 secreted protein [Streptococcus pneumoniae]
MKKNRGIQKLAILALLGVLCLVIQFLTNSLLMKNKQLEIRVESQKKSNGLDVGKAD